jgi:hypothetical protein
VKAVAVVLGVGMVVLAAGFAAVRLVLAFLARDSFKKHDTIIFAQNQRFRVVPNVILSAAKDLIPFVGGRARSFGRSAPSG